MSFGTGDAFENFQRTVRGHRRQRLEGCPVLPCPHGPAWGAGDDWGATGLILKRCGDCLLYTSPSPRD
eukprot:7016990-Alexandrium_andersonii.AAC.1